MTILVTGAGGFLGASVVERLVAHGHRNIRCLVRTGSSAPRLEELAARVPAAAIKIVRGNLVSREGLSEALQDVDTVIHLAASMKGAAADMVLNTVVGSRNLLDAIGQRRPMRVILVSSFSVYGVADLGPGALVNEDTPLETRPHLRDPYTYCKLRQEQLFRDYVNRYGFELVILRPGVIYGPAGGHLSARVGFSLFGVFLHLGHGNVLPLTFVDNCAEAIVVAGLARNAGGCVFNVVDDDLPTCRQYLRAYKQKVRPLRSVPVPRFAARILSRRIERYHAKSRGQLPAVLTPYLTATLWGGNRFDNTRLKNAGWRPIITTKDGMAQTFDAFSKSLS